jgi:hypothetical protein
VKLHKEKVGWLAGWLAGRQAGSGKEPAGAARK